MHRGRHSLPDGAGVHHVMMPGVVTLPDGIHTERSLDPFSRRNGRAIHVFALQGILSMSRYWNSLLAGKGKKLRCVLYVVFVLSGAAGLIYESIWSRYLGLFVGHSAYAQIIVLAIFLGGMSIGAMAMGQCSERLKKPLLWYAGFEFAVGIIGLVFHQGYREVTSFAYEVLFPPLAGSTMLTVVKWAIASVLILPQSILLGTTFPLMSAGVLRRTAGHPGRVLALLYFANSIGAAAGVLCAGFYLIAWFGLPGTILTAACLNFIVAISTYAVVRFIPTPASDTVAAAAPQAGGGAEHGPHTMAVAPLWRLLLFVSFATASASFIYEIVWMRMLSLVLGSATHSFELMLSAFILGLALGALWVRQRADRFRQPLRALGVVQWLMGCAALATLPLYMASFEWMVALLAAFTKTDQGYMAFNLARYATCLAVMLPSTFCAGVTLPLITKILVVSGKGERAIGWVYGLNTLGSIVGVILASLILLPWIGLKSLLIVGATCDMALGMLIFARMAPSGLLPRWPAVAAGTATVLMVLVAAWGTTLDRTLLTSGVYRNATLPKAGERTLLFYQDGRTATVAAVRTQGRISLSTNGKPDAALAPTWFAKRAATEAPKPFIGDDGALALLPLLTLAHVPHARIAAVIGHGSGISAHLLLGSPTIEHLVTIEIEPAMIDGSRVFYPANRRTFEDHRSTFVIDDAKSVLAAEQRQYDLIFSEPSNPWVSGVASLFTTEFYARVAPRLSAHGIFGQWLQLYELNDSLVLSVLAALHEHFQAYEIFLIDQSNILIVASNLPDLPPPDWSVLSLPDIASELQAFMPLTPESLEATRLIHRTALAPLLDTWSQPNSDFFPVLDLGAEKTRYLGTSARGFTRLSGARFNLVAPFFGRRVAFGSREEVPISGHFRMMAQALSTRLRAGRERAGRIASPADALLRNARHRLWQWENTLAVDRPPADWRLWLNDVMRIEAALHGGTAGTADEDFYQALHHYLKRHDAPPDICHAITFIEGLARWDFAAAARAADFLLQSAINGESWIQVDLLRDGAAVSKLLIGDVTGARRYFGVLATKSRPAPAHLGFRLLTAYLLHGEKLPKRPLPSTSMVSLCPESRHALSPSPASH